MSLRILIPAFCACLLALPVFVKAETLLDIPLTLNNTQEVHLRDYVGKPMIVHFWATSCGHCAREMPHLDAFAAKNSASIHILPIAIPYGREVPVHLYYQRFGLQNLYNIYDKDKALYTLMRGRGVPVTFFLDANGKILDVVEGAIPWQDTSIIQAIYQMYGLVTSSLPQSNAALLP